ncbi:heparinase II/III domain-containing protein [Paenibacillus radicis (ex Xue et al. 2023)]|uniref:Heparinase II/III family protein n=1 Tax=Paenibacillus radicis (ex Xue et al. 2023) TaxID=2972489 RepID=A0ABT1YLJ7_9BACL|nr:heparinase II/III family protein [Paenibacillus radicis (ex Xue et al. 2023)]MCR8634058.1 heparinase II/III family protein [Paenibacillus radicis (ex Xue et al. 2023)]
MSTVIWTPAFFEHIRTKCMKYHWAADALQRFREPNAEFVKNAPADIPLVGGGWSHNYSCPHDGARLVLQDRQHHQCPACETVWSGSPWDEVAIANEHWRNSIRCRDAAVLYGIEGDLVWADTARHILLYYALHYEQYPLHDKLGGADLSSGKVQCQTLSEASWLAPLAQAFAILKHNGGLTAEEQDEIESRLLRPALDVIGNNPKEKSNWQTYHNAAKALVAAALGDNDLMAEVVDDPENGFLFQMEHSLADDGFWYEGSWGYHFYTLEAQVMIAIAGLSFEMKLYEHPRFQRMFQVPLDCMFPDGTLPAVHDSGEVQLKRYSHLYEFSLAHFGMGERMVSESQRNTLYSLLFGEALEQESKKPTQQTLEFVDLKRSGMIFSNWESPSQEQSQMAMMDYGEHGGEHGHQDKLNILFYAQGHPWLTDAGTMPYGNPMHFGYFKHTVAHNTVAIGAKSQASAEGILQKTIIEGTAFMETIAEVQGTYPGVFMQRKIVMADSLLFDVFHVRCDQARDIDWIIHTQGIPLTGQNGIRITSELQSESLGSTEGYNYLKGIQLLDLSGSQNVMEWQWDRESQSADRLALYLLDAVEDEQIYLAESPALSNVKRRSTFIRRRKQVTETTFVGILHTFREGEPALRLEKQDLDWSLQLGQGNALRLSTGL